VSSSPPCGRWLWVLSGLRRSPCIRPHCHSCEDRRTTCQLRPLWSPPGADAFAVYVPDRLAPEVRKGLRERPTTSKNCSMRLDSVTSLLSSSRRPASVEAPRGPSTGRCLDAAVSKAFSALCRPVAGRTWRFLTVAFLRVLGAVRSGARPTLSLAALFRVLPTPGNPAMAREKTSAPFPAQSSPGTRVASPTDLARLIFWFPWSGTLADSVRPKPKPVLHKLCSRESLFKAEPYLWPFTPSNIRGREKDRAQPESAGRSVSRGYRDRLAHSCGGPVFIGDRGYARAALLRQSNRQGRLYIIRGRAGTRV